MDEYIKREEAIKIAESYKPQNGSSFCRNRGIADYIAEDISMIPSADVAPVRHGMWLLQVVLGQKAWYCSESKTLGSPHWKWCPVCGCKMDLEAT